MFVKEWVCVGKCRYVCGCEFYDRTSQTYSVFSVDIISSVPFYVYYDNADNSIEVGFSSKVYGKHTSLNNKICLTGHGKLVWNFV